jgi:hypothetical protein
VPYFGEDLMVDAGNSAAQVVSPVRRALEQSHEVKGLRRGFVALAQANECTKRISAAGGNHSI